MEALAEDPLPSTHADEVSEPVDERADPSGLRLAVTSIGAFVAVVMIGGVIGLFAANGNSDVDTDLAAAVAAPIESAPVLDATVVPTTVTPATLPPTTVPPTTLPTTSDAPIDAALRADDVVVVEPTVVVRGVTELALPIAPGEAEAAASVEFLDLPKAVYDEFTLRVGESLVINIAANDRVAGVLESVTQTGLGELAPGFVLAADGTLSGTAVECGQWSAQYALNSSNPAIGTSWVDITVAGCPTT